MTKTNKNAYINKDKYRKLIVWNPEMKELLEEAAKMSGLTVTGFIKKCVADKLKELNIH